MGAPDTKERRPEVGPGLIEWRGLAGLAIRLGEGLRAHVGALVEASQLSLAGVSSTLSFTARQKRGLLTDVDTVLKNLRGDILWAINKTDHPTTEVGHLILSEEDLEHMYDGGTSQLIADMDKWVNAMVRQNHDLLVCVEFDPDDNDRFVTIGLFWYTQERRSHYDEICDTDNLDNEVQYHRYSDRIIVITPAPDEEEPASS